METPIFTHQQFLEHNRDILQTHPLPEPLQKRIEGFDRLAEHLKETSGDDYEKLLARLEKLSDELDEDLEEYFEDHLEKHGNEPPDNSMAGFDLPGHELETDHLPIRPAAFTEQHGVYHGRSLQSIMDEEMISEGHEPQEPVELSDEDLLDQATKENVIRIHPTELIRRGFKGALNSRTVLVGKFCLKRGKYQTCYRISLIEE